jgi:hypothetical protein
MIKRSLPLIVVVAFTLIGGGIYGWFVDENFRALFREHRMMMWVIGLWTIAYFIWLYVAFDYLVPGIRHWLSRVTGVRITERTGIGLGSPVTVWDTQNAGLLGCGLELLQLILNITILFIPILALIAYVYLELFRG